ncbi:MAG: hypothetical protein HGA96_15880 [Desulfobulbaceae bacterium]|nr:hypothetical protein [Desulfobulbaceae bacterium]
MAKTNMIGTGIDRTKWEWGVWSVLALTGVCLVLFRISHGSIWEDEAFSMAISERSFSDILRMLGGSDSSPPLYYFGLKVFVAIFGQSRVAFRVFSALGLLAASLLLGYGPVSRIFSRQAGQIYAFLMLFSSMNLTFAQEIRMYSWALFFMTACGLFGYLYVRDGARRDLVFFGLASLAGAYTHYYVTFGVFFVHFYLLGWIVFCRRSRLRLFFGEVAGVAALFAPWFFSTFISQLSRHIENFWIQEPTFETLIGVFVIPFSVKTGSMGYATDLAIACFVLYGYGLYVAYKQQDNPIFLLLAAGSFFSVLAVMFGVSLTLRPLLVPRYLLSLWGLIFVGVAWGVSLIFRWKPPWGWVVGSLLLGIYVTLAVPCLQLHYFSQLNGPMDEIRAFSKKNFHKNQAFVYFDATTAPCFIVEYPDYPHFVLHAPTSKLDDSFEVFGDKVTIVTDISQVPRRYGELWLVATPDSPNSQEFLETALKLGADPGNLIEWEEGGGGIRFSALYSDFIVDLIPVRRR